MCPSSHCCRITNILACGEVDISADDLNWTVEQAMGILLISSDLVVILETG